jgi:hypothetical protein
MNARLFFLTLLANNLPESGERQYQNKGTPRHPDAMASIIERTKRKNLRCLFFRQTKCQRCFRCSAASEPDSSCLNRRDTERDGARVNLYGRPRICMLCNVGLVRPPNYPGARTAYPKNGGGTRHARSTRAKAFDKNKNRE